MPDREEEVRVAGTIRITCIVISAGTMITFTAIARKLLLVEAIEERTVPEDLEGVLAATVENMMRRTVIAKGAMEVERSTSHLREGTLRGTAIVKETPEGERLPGHSWKGAETTTNRKRQNEDPL